MAEVQISAWGGAGLERLAQLLDSPGNKKREIPGLPVMLFHGHDVILCFISIFDNQGIIAASACLGLGRSRPMHLLGKFLGQRGKAEVDHTAWRKGY